MRKNLNLLFVGLIVYQPIARAAAPITCQFSMLSAIENRIGKDIRLMQSMGQGLSRITFEELEKSKSTSVQIQSIPGLGEQVCQANFSLVHEEQEVLGCPSYTVNLISLQCFGHQGTR